MSKIEEAKALYAVAGDTARKGKERLAALLKANDLRSEMKVGWAKIVGEQINYAGALSDLQDLVEAEASGASTKRADDAGPGVAPAKADKPKRERKPKADAKPVDPNRGKISALIRAMVMDASKTYEDIVAAVKKAHPEAKTTARSIASIAADLRRAGQDVPSRRPVAKPKAEKGAEAAA